MDNQNKEKFDPMKYHTQYAKEHYDQILIIAQKGMKSDILKKAKTKGMSLSKYILTAIQFYEDTNN